MPPEVYRYIVLFGSLRGLFVTAFEPQLVLPSPYDRLCGIWRVTRHATDQQGNKRTLEGVVEFSAMFGGRAVQDQWMVPEPGERTDTAPEGGFWGTTIHFFDDTSDTVSAVWIDPDQQVALWFTGVTHEDGFELTSIDASRYARWQLDLSSDHEAIWHAYRGESADGPWTEWEVMNLTRVADVPD